MENKNITEPVSSLETSSLDSNVNKEKEFVFEKKPMKLKDLIMSFRKDLVENGCYAFHLHFRYSSKLVLCHGYDPDNDVRVDKSYNSFIDEIPDLYVRQISLDIGGPNTWSFRVEVWLEDKDFALGKR